MGRSGWRDKKATVIESHSDTALEQESCKYIFICKYMYTYIHIHIYICIYVHIYWYITVHHMSACCAILPWHTTTRFLNCLHTEPDGERDTYNKRHTHTHTDVDTNRARARERERERELGSELVREWEEERVCVCQGTSMAYTLHEYTWSWVVASRCAEICPILVKIERLLKDTQDIIKNVASIAAAARGLQENTQILEYTSTIYNACL